MDVTNEDHVKHALDYIAENLPAGQQGKKNQHIFMHIFRSFLLFVDGVSIYTRINYNKTLSLNAFSALIIECEKK